MKKLPFIVFIFFYLTINIQAQERTLTPNDLVRKMFSKVNNIKTISFDMYMEERLENGKMFKQKAFFKVNYQPFELYHKQVFPEKGLEIIYKKGKNKGNALVNPNKFPYVNLNLDPQGGLMRENQHHPIFHSGFKYVANILEHIFNKYEKDIDKMVTGDEEIVWKGKKCIKYVMQNSNFKLIDYTVQKNEDLHKIANKFNINDYMIMAINSDVDDFDDVEEGQKIKIPSDYAKKMVFYLDKKNNLPIMMQIFDNKGLYEQYEFTNVKVNPNFSAKDFDEENKEYDF